MSGGAGNIFDSNQITTSIHGIDSRNSESSTFTDNRVELMFGRGIGFLMRRSDDHTIAGNSVSGADEGFSLNGSGNTIEYNTAMVSDIGFTLDDGGGSSANNSFRGNNADGAAVGMLGLTSGSGNTFSANVGFAIEPVMTITEDTTLDSDHTGSVVIAADNVTLDCAGHEIFGREPQRFEPTVFGAGIEIRGHHNVTIENCYVNGFEVGIGLWEAHDNTIRSNTIATSSASIWVMESEANELADNTVSQADRIGQLGGSVVLKKSRGNTVRDNNVETAILLRRAHGNTVQDNRVRSVSLLRSNRNPVSANRGSVVDLERSDRNSLIENMTERVGLTGSSENDVLRNKSSRFGVAGKNSANNDFVENIAEGDGVCFYVSGGTHDNSFTGNRAVGCKIGFRLGKTHGNTFTANNATEAETPLHLSEPSPDGGNIFIDNIGFE